MGYRINVTRPFGVHIEEYYAPIARWKNACTKRPRRLPPQERVTL